MPATTEALNILFILLPGLLAQLIVEALAPKEPRDTLSRVIAALVFIFPIYGLSWLVSSLLELLTGTSVRTFPVDPVSVIALPNIHIVSALLLLAVTCSWGLLWGWLVVSGHLYGVLKQAGITHYTGKETAWEDAFSRTYENYVRVYLKDGRVIAGHAR